MLKNPLLSIENLSVEFSSDAGTVQALQNISFQMFPGETLGLVGESGSGKSVTALSVMKLLPQSNSRITGGKILFDHPKMGIVDLLSLSETQMQQVRGRHISMIFQEPMTSLNPVKRCGPQVEEVLLVHGKATQNTVKKRVLDLFTEVQMPNPERIYKAWPHELSGGQQQRIMIAMAVACNPLLLIADEPTTALDSRVQESILMLMENLQTSHGMAVLFISHDLKVVSRISRHMGVMYNGSLVECRPKEELLAQPLHPYTKALIACKPNPKSRPLRLGVVDDFLADSLQKEKIAVEDPFARQQRHALLYSAEPILKINQLHVHYPTARNILGKPTRFHKAVQDLSFEVFAGETLGLVGESGCGKTTLGRAVMRLVDPTSGVMVYKGTNLANLNGRALKAFRKKIQVIFQDPYSSLTPGLQIGKAIVEPMRTHRILKTDKERQTAVFELLERVGLEENHFFRYPHEFSGGQRQRIAIARALALQPEFLICDEAVSALDVSVQAQVLNLLNSLKNDFGLTYLFISHDLNVVKYMSDRILVMQNGQLVELKEADELFTNPETPYSQELIRLA